MMNSNSTEVLSNKENIGCKATFTESTQRRAFGTDITNIVIGQIDIDQIDASDPQRIGYYAREIYDYLHSIEPNHLPNYGYIRNQPDINEKMRAILIDWLIEVHYKFKLTSETLFLTTNLIDRYLEKVQINRSRLQLVGVSALFIASKYEEIYPPEVRDFVYITDQAYTKEDILSMENDILQVLQFNISQPSAFRFLERYFRLSGLDDQSFFMARYFIELPLIEYQMLRYNPSLIAASAIYLNNKIAKREPAWPINLMDNSGYRENDLKNCAKDICVLLQGVEKCSLQAVRKKFSLPKFGEVAKLQLFWTMH